MDLRVTYMYIKYTQYLTARRFPLKFILGYYASGPMAKFKLHDVVMDLGYAHHNARPINNSSISMHFMTKIIDVYMLIL